MRTCRQAIPNDSGEDKTMTWFPEFSQVIHEAAHLGQLDHLEAAGAG